MFRRPASTNTPQKAKRRGVAAVELALVLPIFMTIAFVAIESGHALNKVQVLEGAVRDGGRMAAKDIEPSLLLAGQTANDKVIADIKNMLVAEGFPAASLTVTLTHADGATVGQTFDLSLASNQHKLVQVKVTCPYTAVSMFPMSMGTSRILDGTLIVSRGRSTLNL